MLMLFHSITRSIAIYFFAKPLTSVHFFIILMLPICPLDLIYQQQDYKFQRYR